MAYERINWQNEPSEATALNDVNLNKMDSAIYDHDQRIDTAEENITDLQSGKVDKETNYGLSYARYIEVGGVVNTGNVIGGISILDQSGHDRLVQIRNGVVIDSALSDSSENPVQNKVVKSALDNKVDKESGKGLSTLSALGVTASATTGTQIADIVAYDQSGTEYHNPIKNGVVVDSALSNESENPVQNKVVKESISDILPTNTATGNPIVINDGMKLPASECKVTMNPIQDLHGYDHPWAGGAGKNKFDEVYPNISANLTYVEVSVGSGDFTLSTNMPLNNANAANLFLRATPGAVNSSTHGVWNAQSRTVTAVDGKVYIYYRNQDISPENYNSQLESGNTATAYEPYSNICPISGRNSVTVTRTGKNLAKTLNGEYATGYGTNVYANGYNDFTITGKEGGFTAPANSSNSVMLYLGQLDAGTYTLSFNKTVSTINSRVRKSTTKEFPFTTTDATSNTQNTTITFTADGTSHYWLNCFASNTAYDYSNVQLEQGSTATTYEPYTAETHTHTYASTVYGAVDDFVSGEGSSDRVLVEYDGSSDEGWAQNGSSGVYITVPTEYRVRGKAYMMNKYQVLPTAGEASSMSSGQSRWNTNYTAVQIKDENGMTVSAFRQLLQANPLQILYYTDTPATITNTPEDISLLKGVNVLSTDGDSLELKYSGEIQSSGGVNYSTDEQDTGIKWIDGKTIYQKTLTGVMSRGEYEYYFLCIIGTLSNAHLIKSEGVVWNDNNGYQIPINSAGTTNSMPTGDLQTFLYNRAGTLCLTLTQDSTLVGYNYAVTIYYTKA